MSTRQVVGDGDHAVSVAESVQADGYPLVAFTSDLPLASDLVGLPVPPEVPESHVRAGRLVVVAVGDNAARERVWGDVSSRLPFDHLPTIIHPSATVSRWHRSVRVR